MWIVNRVNMISDIHDEFSVRVVDHHEKNHSTTSDLFQRVLPSGICSFES